MKDWKIGKLGDVLTPARNTIKLDPQKTYKQITIRMNHKGVILRGMIQGSQVGSKQYLAEYNQFIISKIDARNGAYGIVPIELQDAIVTGDFLLYDTNDTIDVAFLNYFSNTPYFEQECKKASEGTTNRVRLKTDKFYQIPIPLPSPTEQQRIVQYLDSLKNKIESVRILRGEQEQLKKSLLYALFTDTIKNAKWMKLSEVAPIIRREIAIDENKKYPELGIRSFGKGTFHKPPINGIEVGTKRLFQIKERDLIFSNVFAWEGAIAVVKKEDNDRFGSHRFISCLCDESMALPEFLCYYLLTQEGLEKINKASPGGAGRNKTLGLTKLEQIEVPIPSIHQQGAFIKVQTQLQNIKAQQTEQQAELNNLLPSLLDKAFRGAL